MNPYQALKERCFRCNLELPKRNLVLYTFGNVSALDREQGVYAIKPSGMDYENLRAEDMVVVDLDDKIVDGKHRPSSDSRTHTVLYKNFTGIGGVVHTHSTYAVAWAQACRPVPILGTTHADHLATDVPCTRMMPDAMIKGDYERETGNLILEFLKKHSYREIEMILVAGHGPFTWGETPEKAVYNSVVLEELARMALFTLQIQPRSRRLKKSLIEKHYFRKHGKDAYYGQKPSQGKEQTGGA